MRTIDDGGGSTVRIGIIQASVRTGLGHVSHPPAGRRRTSTPLRHIFATTGTPSSTSRRSSASIAEVST